MKRKALQILILLTVCYVGNVFAQETSKIGEQCKINATREIYGGKITIVEKLGIRGVLNIINKQYGCKFVVDKSVTQIIFNLDVTDIPWFRLVRELLTSQNLAIQKTGSVFRVAKIETLEEEKKWKPLVKETIKLLHIPNQTSLNKETLLKIINHLLTKRGTVELEEQTNTLKLTDVRENLDAIKSLIEIIDVKGDWEKSAEQNRKLEPVRLAKPN